MAHIENLWANAEDDAEVRRIIFTRLPLKMIRECEILPVLDQVEEDVNVMQPDYELVRNKLVPLPNWS